MTSGAHDKCLCVDACGLATALACEQKAVKDASRPVLLYVVFRCCVSGNGFGSGKDDVAP